MGETYGKAYGKSTANTNKSILDKYYSSHIDRAEGSYHCLKLRGSKFVRFPRFTGINVNMMPIETGSHRGSLLPENMKGYEEMVWQCLPYAGARNFQESLIMYVTIHEERVEVGASHRRGGVHVERPGSITDKKGRILKQDWSDEEYRNIAWGGGLPGGGDVPIDGIFMASNISGSCNVWPLVVESPERVSDEYGSLEHLRHLLGPPISTEANKMYWMTDRTPHESAPIPPQPNGETFVNRQYFRLVMGKVSVWYTEHNTPNPLGILPDAPLISGNKFDSKCMWIRLQALYRGYRARRLALEKRLNPDALFNPVFKARRVDMMGVAVTAASMKG